MVDSKPHWKQIGPGPKPLVWGYPNLLELFAPLQEPTGDKIEWLPHVLKDRDQLGDPSRTLLRVNWSTVLQCPLNPRSPTAYGP